jgi:hypothetical protein
LGRRLTLLAAPTVAALPRGRGACRRRQLRLRGGTQAEQAQVRAALEASSFNWNLVPSRITIHISRDIPSSQAAPGEIWLDAGLLATGRFSWAFVPHEYAHQVDFFLLDDAERAGLEQALGSADMVLRQTAAPRGLRLRAVRVHARLGLLAVARQRARAAQCAGRVGRDATGAVP